MSKVLIVNFCLTIGGGEKLVYELANFALQNGKQPVILVPNNFSEEYYDPIFKKMNIKVVRTRLTHIKTLRHPVRIFNSVLWRLRLRFFAGEFSAVHVVNMATANVVHDLIKHKRRYYWHIGNANQYQGGEIPFNKKLFSNANDTLVCINEYQLPEIEQQYGSISCKKFYFKLFLS